MLKKLGIVKSKNKSYRTFMTYVEPDFMNNTMPANEYVAYCWSRYMDAPINHSNSLNGLIFELIIATLFVKEGILPLYLQAEVAFVPNVNFDAILYTSEKIPIGISLKTSLRERYKQADLEAIALKYVHRKAENYLFTLDPSEAASVTQKIADGSVMGLNKAVLTTTPAFNDFINDLKTRTFITPGSIPIIVASSTITADSVQNATAKRK